MTIYVMPQALVSDWNGDDVFPNADQYSYRNVEGHGPEKAFRYNGFEKTRSNNPNILHTYASDTYLRMQKIFVSGELEVGDQFVLGIGAPELTELDSIFVRQRNTVEGLELKITVIDGNYATVEDEGITIDFSNGCTGGRWDEQPVQKFRYNNAGSGALAGENELFWLVAEVVALPAQGEWLSDCSGGDLPEFEARVHYNDSCLAPTQSTVAPVDVYNAWASAVAGLTTDVVLWKDIEVSKTGGGFGATLPSAPAPAEEPDPVLD